MGNIGRSSTGCYLCRKRKIKCDEGKPGCKRCAQIRKPCPGYPFSVELDICTMSEQPQTLQVPARPAVLVHSLSDSRVPQATSTRIIEPTTAPLPLTEIPEAESESTDYCLKASPETQQSRNSSVKCEFPSSERTLNLIPSHYVPSAPPKYDVQHQSTCFFLNLFCWQASRVYGAAILDYLPEMLLQSPADSCLNLATKAVSRMTLADRYSGHDVRLQTGKEYVKALSATKAAIREPTEAVKDETFIAVWMLGLYENVNSVLSHGRFDRQHRSLEDEYQSHISHIRGAMNLLKLRGMSQLDNGRSEKIYRIFKATIQMRLFNLNSVVSQDFENLEYDVYQDEHEFLPSKSAQQATHYFHTAARLLENTKFVLRKQGQSPLSKDAAGDLQSILNECEALDAGMAGWAKHEGESGWDLLRIESSTQNTMWALYPSHAMYYFYNFWIFVYWLRYFIARVKLYEGMIVLVQRQKEAVLRRMQPTTADTTTARKASTNHFDFRIQQYRTIIQLTAGQLIGLTAYALGDVTNSGSFYSSSPYASPRSESREVNVIAGLQLVIPLKALQRSESPTPTQKGAIDLALSHIGDGFRRQPLLV